jgi:hypothetical protein
MAEVPVQQPKEIAKEAKTRIAPALRQRKLFERRNSVSGGTMRGWLPDG